MSDLNLQNLKVNEILKFDDYHHILYNDDINLNGMLGIVKSIYQDKSYNHYQIEVELIDKKYSEDLEEWNNCLWFTIPENQYDAKFTILNRKENKILIVHFKSDYGVERMYPTCETSTMIVSLFGGDKSINDDRKETLKKLGYEFKTVERKI